MTRATVEALVESGRAGLLIGHSEEAWLECKEQPYAATETAHYELAKDVSAFANSQSGGLILIGLRTRKRAGRDYVTALAPVPPDDRRADRYRKVVGRRIHPRVTGLSVREVAYRSGAVLVISVPPQPQALWPFMVKGVLRANKIIGNHVAIFHRDDDATVITTVEELHALVIAGRAELAHTAADPTEKKPAAAMEA